jgi:HSP20 family protein
MSMTLFNRPGMFEDFFRSRDDFDRMIGRMLGGQLLGGIGGLGAFGGLGGAESRLPRFASAIEGWMPAVDVSESDDQVVIRAEIPGVMARDLEVTISGTTLTISGKKEEREETEQEDFFRSERRFGAFRRTIELPDTVDSDRVNADCENGVVTIRVAKQPGQRSRRVEVKSASTPTTRRVTVPG